ncbi:MAG TPA: CDP-alcohol phosphatidyltransferase family protein [Rhizomicrobium sp.]
MLDAFLRQNLERYLEPVAARLAGWRVRADALTVSAFILTGVAAADIAHRQFLWGLGFLVAARLADSLDGAVARRTGPTVAGATLDIVLGLIATAVVPFAFALAEPERALAAMFLMLGLVAQAGAGTVPSAAPPLLLGRSEFFIVFAAACIFPQWFSLIAYIVGILCFLAAGRRVAKMFVSAGP